MGVRRRTERGYGDQYRRLVALKIRTDKGACPRCSKPIEPGGHDEAARNCEPRGAES